MDYYGNNDYRYHLALRHHGILGMKWGKRNGPPYPLGSSDHSASEKKAGWRKSLGGGLSRNRRKVKKSSKYFEKLYTLETHYQPEDATYGPKDKKKMEKLEDQINKINKSIDLKDLVSEVNGKTLKSKEYNSVLSQLSTGIKISDNVKKYSDIDDKVIADVKKQLLNKYGKINITKDMGRWGKDKPDLNEIARVVAIEAHSHKTLPESTKSLKDSWKEAEKNAKESVPYKKVQRETGLGRGLINEMSVEKLRNNKKIREAFNDPELQKAKSEYNKVRKEFKEALETFDDNKTLQKKYSRDFDSYLNDTHPNIHDREVKARSKYQDKIQYVAEDLLGKHADTVVDMKTKTSVGTRYLVDARYLVSQALYTIDEDPMSYSYWVRQH